MTAGSEDTTAGAVTAGEVVIAGGSETAGTTAGGVTTGDATAAGLTADKLTGCIVGCEAGSGVSLVVGLLPLAAGGLLGCSTGS